MSDEEREELRARILELEQADAQSVAMFAKVCAERDALKAEVERLRDILASGFAMKTHDLAMRDSWVIDDVESVREAIREGGAT